jgi:peptidoglycan/LPS O-acetylase OafA/YrhL
MPKDGSIDLRPRTRPDLAAGAPFGIGRRTELDWLRVIAFGLLILFHVGLVYAPFDWHIHSRYTADWLRQGILVTGPWRLTLLFLISGAALKLMSRRMTASGLLRARLVRLLPPAVFGILVLVPPQAFIEATTKGWWSGDLWSWWLHEFSAQGLAEGVPVNHLWFVLYIIAYSVGATVLVARPGLQAALGRGAEFALRGPLMLLLPIVYLTLVRQGLFLHYGISNHITADWYNHAVSLAAFLLGFVVVGRQAVWRTLIRWRWASAALAAVSLPTLMMIEAVPETTPETWWNSLVFGADQWASIAAVLGFGAKHLANRDGPVLRYLTEAVFPCYLAHQTILVGATWMIRSAALPAPVEAAVLVTVTVGGCFAVYEIVRRLGPLRPLFGLKTLSRRTPAEPAALRPEPVGRAEPPGFTAEAA